MKLEKFTNRAELEDYLKVAVLSKYEQKRKHKPIKRYFRSEITQAMEDTAALPEDYEIGKGRWVLFALRNDYNEIIGTAAAGEDYHFGGFVQLEFIAIREDWQQRGMGRLMLNAVLEETASHTRLKNAILSTPIERTFFEKAGMAAAGKLTADGYIRSFYTCRI